MTLQDGIRRFFNIASNSSFPPEAATMLVERVVYLTDLYFKDKTDLRNMWFLLGFLDGMDYTSRFTGGLPVTYILHAQNLDREEFIKWLNE